MTSAPSVIIICIKKTETDVDNFNVQQGCGKLYTLQLTSSSQLLYTARLYVPWKWEQAASKDDATKLVQPYNNLVVGL